MNKKQLAAGLIWVVVAAIFAQADDDFAPTWRGSTGSVHAEFDAWAGFYYAPPAGSVTVPDDWSTNPFSGVIAVGTPEAERVNAGTLNLHPRNQVVEIKGEDGLIIKIRNYENANPVKKIRLQLTYEQSHAPSGFAVWTGWGKVGTPQVFTAGSVLVANSVVKDGGWITAAYEIKLHPNPAAETIGLRFDGYSAFVDQVVVDTLCTKPTNCADVWELGLGMPMDFNHNCRVDMLDFAEFAEVWLACNDPQDANCDTN
ncbi:MAG: hypothetical protein NTW55_06540 [Planctomycetota bacterium]|nr:hypothetical protein [Planctomycetota bacterium]